MMMYRAVSSVLLIATQLLFGCHYQASDGVDERQVCTAALHQVGFSGTVVNITYVSTNRAGGFVSLILRDTLDSLEQTSCGSRYIYDQQLNSLRLTMPQSFIDDGRIGIKRGWVIAKEVGSDSYKIYDESGALQRVVQLWNYD